MFEGDHYELLDFGGGRKLERFGAVVVDRPSPAAEAHQLVHPDLWADASARFDVERGSRGSWTTSEVFDGLVAEPWIVDHGEARLTLQLGPSGNIGVSDDGGGAYVCTCPLVLQRPRVHGLRHSADLSFLSRREMSRDAAGGGGEWLDRSYVQGGYDKNMGAFLAEHDDLCLSSCHTASQLGRSHPRGPGTCDNSARILMAAQTKNATPTRGQPEKRPRKLK